MTAGQTIICRHCGVANPATPQLVAYQKGRPTSTCAACARAQRTHRYRHPEQHRRVALTRDGLMALCVPEPNSGCWLWLGQTNPKGYGRVTYEKQGWVAHRLFYTLTYGPIPDALIVMHTCDTPSCVNPAHLVLGTHKDNAEDRDRKGRRVVPKGEKNWGAGITDALALELRAMRLSGMSFKDIIARTGVHPSSLQSALYGTGRFAGLDRIVVKHNRRIHGE